MPSSNVLKSVSLFSDITENQEALDVIGSMMEKKTFEKNHQLTVEGAPGSQFFVLVSGHDESFHQFVFSRYSYTAQEIVLDRQFKDMMIREGQMLKINIDDISKLKDNV